jgi:CRP-like cAMP-binding protein
MVMRRSDPKVEKLGTLALFHGCSRRQLERLAGAAELVCMRAGSVVIRQGDVAHEVFVMAEGEVTVTRDGAPVATLSAGDHFGEVGVLGHVSRDATVTALTDVELYVFEQRRFLRMLEQLRTVNRALLGAIAHRLHEADLASPRDGRTAQPG